MQFVRPALLAVMDARRIDKPVVAAIVNEDIVTQAGCVNLLRGVFTTRNNEFYLSTTGGQKSPVLRSMSEANCLIVIPAGCTSVKAGERVAVQLTEHDEV